VLLDLRSLFERLAAQIAGEINAVAGVAAPSSSTRAYAGTISAISGIAAGWSFTAKPAARIDAQSGVAATARVVYVPTASIAAQGGIGATWSVIYVPPALVAAQSGISATVLVLPYRYAGAIDGHAQVLGVYDFDSALPLPQLARRPGWVAFVPPLAAARGRYTYRGNIRVRPHHVSAYIRSVGTRPAKAPKLSDEEVLIFMLTLIDDFEEVA
jgi:hypothetical protein